MLIDFRELFPRWNIKPKGVLHVGANVGEEAPVYFELGIKKAIFFEPNTQIFNKLRENLSDPKYEGNYVAFIHCVGDEDGKPVALHIANNGGQSSSVLDLGTHAIVHPDVKYIGDEFKLISRIDTLWNELDIFSDNYKKEEFDFLNLDVQGYEGHVLRGMGKVLDNIKWIYTEINSKEVYKKCMQLPEMDEFLAEEGFKRVETFNPGGFLDRLGWSDALYIR